MDRNIRHSLDRNLSRKGRNYLRYNRRSAEYHQSSRYKNSKYLERRSGCSSRSRHELHENRGSQDRYKRQGRHVSQVRSNSNHCQNRYDNHDCLDYYKYSNPHDSQARHHVSLGRRSDYHRQDRQNPHESRVSKDCYKHIDHHHSHNRQNHYESLNGPDGYDSQDHFDRCDSRVSQVRRKHQFYHDNQGRRNYYNHHHNHDCQDRQNHHDHHISQDYSNGYDLQDRHNICDSRNGYKHQAHGNNPGRKNHQDHRYTQTRQCSYRGRLDQTREAKERRDERVDCSENGLYHTAGYTTQERRHYYSRRERSRRQILRARIIKGVKYEYRKGFKSRNVSVNERYNQLELHRSRNRLECTKRDEQRDPYSLTYPNMEHRTAKNWPLEDCEDEIMNHIGYNDMPESSCDADDLKMKVRGQDIEMSSGGTSPSIQMKVEKNVDFLEKFLIEIHADMRDIHNGYLMVWNLIKKIYILCKLKKSLH